MIEENPLTGSGIHSFRANYMNHQADYLKKHPQSEFQLLADDVLHPFNEYLKICIEQGIAGLFFFFSVIFILLYPGKLKNKSEKVTEANAIAKTILIFLLTFACFSYPSEQLPFHIIFIFCLAIISNNLPPFKEIRIPGQSLPSYIQTILKTGTGLTLFLIILFTGRYMLLCNQWDQALKKLPFDRKRSISQLETLYPDLNHNPVYTTIYGRILADEGLSDQAIPVLKQAIRLQPSYALYIDLGRCYEQTGPDNQALRCWEKASYMIPSRFTPDFLSMNFYLDRKDYTRAGQYADRLLSRKIKIDSPEIDWMLKCAREANTRILKEKYPANEINNQIMN